MSCLSRPALEASCKDTPVLPRQKVKDTRAALVQHFATGSFVHPGALFAPAAPSASAWVAKHAVVEVEDDEAGDGDSMTEHLDGLEGDQPSGETIDHPNEDGAHVDDSEAWRVAAE